MSLAIKYDSQYLKPNIINKVDSTSNVLGNKISEKLDIPGRKATDIVFGWRGACQDVLRHANYTNVAHICNKF
jgi:hypothetical protein